MRVEAKERQVRKPSDSVKETFPEQSGQSRDKAGERRAVAETFAKVLRQRYHFPTVKEVPDP